VRLDEALVLAAFYLDAHDLESTRNLSNFEGTQPHADHFFEIAGVLVCFDHVVCSIVRM
jgi:hypothetical protein